MDVLTALVASGCDSTRLFEMYYWTRDPAMLEIMRAVAALPEEARASLEAFFTMSHEPAAIAADWDVTGRLTLTSPQVGQAMAIMRHCAQSEDPETAPIPN